jgi:hypothetical protein
MTQQNYTNSDTATIAEKRYSFKKGFYGLSRKEKSALRDEVLKTFGFVNNASFYNRVNGLIEFSAREKEVMDMLLAKYNIRWDYQYEQAD